MVVTVYTRRLFCEAHFLFLVAWPQKKCRRKWFRFGEGVNLSACHHYVFLESKVVGKNEWHGSSKGILKHRAYEEANDFIPVLLGGRGLFSYFLIRHLKRVVNRVEGAEVRSIHFSMMGFPWITVVFARLLFPDATISFRSHNAEGIHRIDYFKCSKTTVEKIRALRFAVTGIFSDWVISRVADWVLPVSDHDLESYWAYFCSRRRLICLPYVGPEFKTDVSDLDSIDFASKPEGALRVVSVGSAVPGSVTLDQEMRFYHYVGSLDGSLDHQFEFIQTNAAKRDLAPGNVTCLDFVEDFDRFMSDIDIVVVAGRYGRGAKTKIIDAVLSGIPVVCHIDLFRRLDVDYRAGVFPFSSETKFKDSLVRARELVQSSHYREYKEYMKALASEKAIAGGAS